jgi:hypothetical protein
LIQLEPMEDCIAHELEQMEEGPTVALTDIDDTATKNYCNEELIVSLESLTSFSM